MLNLDFTVAVTQNFVSPANLEAAVQWQALGAGEIGEVQHWQAFTWQVA